jgi:predicted nucleic-acid-binding Zn-ribbon protein
MNQHARCSRCGSQNIEIGRIRGTGRMVFEHTRNIFDWGRPMIATACLDCGHVELALRNVSAAGVESEPLDLVEQYRKLASILVTTTDQSTIDECRRLLDELRSQ